MNKKYSFNKGIQNKLKDFKAYLQGLGQDKNTIRQKANYTGYFLNWLESERLQPEETLYNDLLSFIDHCKSESLSRLGGRDSRKHINSKLRAIRNYYEYLKKQTPSIINPAAGLYVKGVRNKLPHDILPFESLQQLYHAYPVIDDRSKRNKIILGMLIYQGITTDELMKLTTTDVRLQEGKVYIPGSRRSNGRQLELRPFQVIDLYEYITQIRSGLVMQQTGQLFISMEGNVNMKSSLYHLFRALKRISPGIRNAKQVRASVITNWLKNHNLRQVQYMAGHRHVCSTERYQLNNLEGLKELVDKYHPLG